MRELGNSNFSAAELRAADASAAEHGTPRYVSAQNEYNLLDRGTPRTSSCPPRRALGIGFLPYFPLANGLFTGKFTRTDRPADTRISRQRPHVADNAPWDAMEAYRGVLRRARHLHGRGDVRLVPREPGAVERHRRARPGPSRRGENAAAGSGWRPDAAELAAIDGFFPRLRRG